MPAYDAFLSHASEDAAQAARLVDGLEAKGVRCWIAPRNVRAAHSYAEEIIQGIENSSALVLLLTKTSNTKKFVAREVERAFSKERPIVVVRSDPVTLSQSLELFVASNQWIEARGLAEQDIVNQVAYAVGRVGPNSSRRQPPPERPPQRTSSFLDVTQRAGSGLVSGLGSILAPSSRRSVRDPDNVCLRIKEEGRPATRIHVSRHLLSGRPVVIGRSRSADIALSHLSVSGRHATLEYVREQLLLKDLGSENGTYHNGERLEPGAAAVLEGRDSIVLGRSKIKLLP